MFDKGGGHFRDVPETPFVRADGKIRGNLSRMSLSVPVMQSTRRYGGLRIFLLYCSLLAIGGPATFWAARLGLRVAPGHVQGFVGWFANIDDLSELFVALPLEGDREAFLAAAELPETMLPDPHHRSDLLPLQAHTDSPSVEPGALLEKPRGHFAYQFDGVPGRWPLRGSHLALFLGGLLAFGALAFSFVRAPADDGSPRALAWLGVANRLALVLAPGVATLVVGIAVAFARGALDRVAGVAMLASAVAAAVAWSRGAWRRLLERVVLRRARRLAARSGAVADLRGTVRRVARDVIELATDDGRVIQADVSAGERLGLGPLPPAPLAVGDRIEVIGAPTEVLDPTGEHFGREAALAQRLLAAGPRPLLIVAL